MATHIKAAETSSRPSPKHLKRLKIIALALTFAGVLLFAFFVYAVGFAEIWDGISRFGFAGFAVILLLYFGRICSRAGAWSLSVPDPDRLKVRHTIPAVMIGEALSSTIPLGILVSGTSKVLAVRKHIHFIAGFSSVAIENLFYSFVTGIFLIAGAAAFARSYAVEPSVVATINLLIGALAVLIAFGLLMVIRQWHFASWFCNWLYKKGIGKKFLEKGRYEVRKFEELLYGFYREHPARFLPICMLEAIYHSLGVVEVLFILNRIADTGISLLSAFLLESVSRLITMLFKLIPFMVGVDEAGAQFVGETIGLAAGVGVTIAIIRKGRILFWTALGFTVLLKRGFTMAELHHIHHRDHG